jgi:ketosteroid isomerase-like protein
MTDATQNKALMLAAFQALAQGDSRPYLALLADDFTFTITGRNSWTRTITGKAAVQRELWGPLFELFADRYTGQLIDITAEGDKVVVEYRGCVTTKRGDLYDNEYCLVCRMRDGQLISLREYADSALVDRVLGPPPWASAPAEAEIA